MISEGQKGVKNVFLWAVNTIMLYLGPNEVTGLKKSKQFLLVVRSLCRCTQNKLDHPVIVMMLNKQQTNQLELIPWEVRFKS